MQLYGTDPVYVGKAAEILAAEHGVAHIDLNFGCPVPKVTRKGGGGALPWKRRLLGDILEAAVRAAEPYDVPVTMKTRKGIDADHLTYLDAGRIAQEAGCAAIALHGRTVDQAYSGQADWSAIGELAAHVDIPVLGNGDIWEAADAVADGRRRPVRPASSSAAAASAGPGCSATWPRRSRASRSPRCPRLGEVAAMMRRHAELLCRAHGRGAGLQGVPQARRVVPQGLRRPAASCATAWRWSRRWPRSTTCCPAWTRTSRSRSPRSAPRAVARAARGGWCCPQGWLDDTDGTGCAVAEDMHSGG